MLSVDVSRERKTKKSFGGHVSCFRIFFFLILGLYQKVADLCGQVGNHARDSLSQWISVACCCFGCLIFTSSTVSG